MNAILIVATASYIMCVAQIIFNVVIGYEKTKHAFAIELITIICYIFYAWLIIKQWHSSITVAWTTEYLYTALILALSFGYLLWMRRKHISVLKSV
jgi:hypothetical protein